MFERYLTDALTTHVGHLISNLDTNKVRISAWKGEIVLKDLELRRTAIQSFFPDCPIEISYGSIGNLEIKIPWKLFRSQLQWGQSADRSRIFDIGNCSVVLSDVNILLTPKKKYDASNDDGDGTSNANHAEAEAEAQAQTDAGAEQTDGQAEESTTKGTTTGHGRREGEHNEQGDGGKDDDEHDDEHDTENHAVADGDGGEKSKISEHLRRSREEKAQNMLDAELIKRVQESSVTSSGRTQWVQEYIANILASLSVTVKNVHVRYEDTGTTMGFAWRTGEQHPPRPQQYGYQQQQYQQQQQQNYGQYRPSFAIGITLSCFTIENRQKEVDDPNRSDGSTPSTQGTSDGNHTKQSEDESTAGNQDCITQPTNAAASANGISHERKCRTASAETLAVYWDSDCHLISSKIHINDEKGDIIPESRSYCAAAFQVLQQEKAPEFLDENYYMIEHTYLLSPMSPSVELDIVTPNTDKANAQTSEDVTKLGASPGNDDDKGNIREQSDADESFAAHTSTDRPQELEPAPASKLSVKFPNCTIAISRNTLEDMAYLRKSFAIWSHQTKGLLSPASLKKLARMRPSKTVKEDARAWWLFAFRATLVLHRVAWDGQNLDIEEMSNRRRHGWAGVVEALRKRRQYVALYRQILSCNQADETSLQDMHSHLITIEDSLTTQEIKAFRMKVYEDLKAEIIEKCTENYGEYISQNIINSTASTHKSHKDDISASEAQANTSLAHRMRMMREMLTILERELVNDSSQQQNEKRISEINIQHLDLERAPSITWRASLMASDFSICVNDCVPTIRHDGSIGDHLFPVVALSCGSSQRLVIFEDGSWDAQLWIASLSVRDMVTSTVTRHDVNAPDGTYPYLISNRATSTESESPADNSTVEIDGEPHQWSISVDISRRLIWNDLDWHESIDSSQRGSNTTFSMRLKPIQLVYATLPVEALSRVLDTVKTQELSTDYQRMASVIAAWQRRQRQRLLQTLANNKKTIKVNIDVGAPVIIIPESLNRSESAVVSLDLGRMRFSNVDVGAADRSEYDDHWRLLLTDVQVQCSSRSTEKVNLVEPFSLEFDVLTRIAPDFEIDPDKPSHILVKATLPSLAFNVTSSALRMVHRLQNDWDKRKRDLKIPKVPTTPLGRTTSGSGTTTSLQRMESYQTTGPADVATLSTETDTGSNSNSEAATIINNDSNKDMNRSTSLVRNSLQRLVVFQFAAPLITLRLTNDAEPSTGIVTEFTPVPILVASVQGIKGEVRQEVHKKSSSSVFEAKLNSIVIYDLYQRAGGNFSLLLSSVLPGHVLKSLDGIDLARLHTRLEESLNRSVSATKDLVKVKFESESFDAPTQPVTPNKLSLQFHELFIEWNPETLVAIQTAIRVPQESQLAEAPLVTDDSKSYKSSDDAFFDAVEDEFFDADEKVGGVYEMTDIDDYDFTIAAMDGDESLIRNQTQHQRPAFLMSNIGMLSTPAPSKSLPTLLQNNGLVPSESTTLQRQPSTQIVDTPDTDSEQPKKSLDFSFTLAKLRVSFNKDARHRAVFVAQMDATSIDYCSRPEGGSLTRMRLGNLVFLDPDASTNQTLYSEILGLQTENFTGRSDDPKTSLLHMEIMINPRSKKTFVDDASEYANDMSRGVFIDREKGEVAGCNFHIDAKFSPMRFVLLEQLWSEIVDYFFAAVIGNEVWGGLPPKMNSLDMEKIYSLDASKAMPGSGAEDFGFTRFNVEIETPVILLPITYRSPHFIRLEMSRIAFHNFYMGDIDLEKNPSQPNLPGKRMQWYNNLSCQMEDLKLSSWCGRDLSQRPVTLGIKVNWPVGPYAFLITPKWKVNCTLQALTIELRRVDYALLQHILTYNIGEASRHQHEWSVLQSFMPSVLSRYNDTIAVHFPYDKKDVVPTTYSVRTEIGELRFVMLDEEDDNRSILAVAECSNLLWRMLKPKDRISRQRVECDIEIRVPKTKTRDDTAGEVFTLLSTKKEAKRNPQPKDVQHDRAPNRDFMYTSMFKPTFDSIKTVDIDGGTIYMIVPAWIRFMGFFQSRPDPTVMTPEEVKCSIQVGDRWYRIGSMPTPSNQDKVEAGGPRAQRITNWLQSIAGSPDYDATKFSQASLQRQALFQFRLLLKEPSIIVGVQEASPNSDYIALGIQNMEFLHSNDMRANQIKRSMFMSGLEIYTYSSSRRSSHSEGAKHSLIHPLNVAMYTQRCDLTRERTCSHHSFKISTDVVKVQASYTDLLIAADVACTAIQDYRMVSASKPAVADNQHEDEAQTSSDATKSHDATSPSPQAAFSISEIECSGITVCLVDDSKRHFARNQELLTLRFGAIAHRREDRINIAAAPTRASVDGATLGTDEGDIHVEDDTDSSGVHSSSSTRLRLESLELIDCLQPPDSIFRQAIMTGGHPIDGGNSGHRPARTGLLEWDDFRLERNEEDEFGHSDSFLKRCTIHLQKNGDKSSGRLPRDGVSSSPSSPHGSIDVTQDIIRGKSTSYNAKLHEMVIQWNPSTVIAVQRFLGRLKKATSTSLDKIQTQPSTDRNSSQHAQTPSNDTSKIPTTEVHDEVHETIHAVIELQRLKVCLNKEHQLRRLLEINLSDYRAELLSSESVLSVHGHLGDLYAWEPEKSRPGMTMPDANRMALSVVRDDGVAASSPAFLKVSYTKSKKGNEGMQAANALPPWINDRLRDGPDIDDYLCVSVAALKLVFLRERTAEILDYLSNGLPGKGMGATSKAAKGFISDRIVTRSFLEINVDSPHVLVPQKHDTERGLSLKLGDVGLTSWFEALPSDGVNVAADDDVNVEDGAGTGNSHPGKIEWWRVLSLRIEGQSAGTYHSVDNDDSFHLPFIMPHNLKLMLRRPISSSGTMHINCGLSMIECNMKYVEYCLLKATLRDNIAHTVDTDSWDNVEKQYWLNEYEDGDRNQTSSLPDEGTDAIARTGSTVTYAANARFVRYGRGSKRQAAKSQPRSDGGNGGADVTSPEPSINVDVAFTLEGVSLRLHRNDPVAGLPLDAGTAAAFDYDVIMMSVKHVEAVAQVYSNGNLIFKLSLSQIGLFDLGDSGRLLRDQYYQRLQSSYQERPPADGHASRVHCPFAVIAEGYAPKVADERDGNMKIDGNEADERSPQLVVSLEKRTMDATDHLNDDSAGAFKLPAGSSMYTVRVGIYHLTLNALIRPLEETLDFLSCSWHNEFDAPNQTLATSGSVDDANVEALAIQKSQQKTSCFGLHMKFIAHYPQVFFLADESNLNSRALVLKGLAIVQATKIVRRAQDERNDDGDVSDTVQRVSALDAQLQALESYINPDVSEALRFRQTHLDLIGEVPESAAESFHSQIESRLPSAGSLGVALIQPVTAGIEFCQVSQALFPTQRTLSVAVEPVSTMLSFEDLGLIEAVMKRWSSDSRRQAKEVKALAPRPSYTILFEQTRLGLGLKSVDDHVIVDSIQDASIFESVSIGDVVMKIDDTDVDGWSLERVVQHVATVKRPTLVTFISTEQRSGTNPPRISLSVGRRAPRQSARIGSRNISALSTIDIDRLIVSYTISLRSGASHGLELERSAVGDFPVVLGIDEQFASSSALDETPKMTTSQPQRAKRAGMPANTRIPRPGAIVVSINGKPVVDMGHEKAMSMLQDFVNGNHASSLHGSNEPPQGARYEIGLLEADSVFWGNIDAVDFTAVDVTLSLIDDLRGRDMPLFRGSLRNIELRLQRGLGVEAQGIDAASPALFAAPQDGILIDEFGQDVALRELIDEIKTDQVFVVRFGAVCSLDYFHPRIAVWEPLLESSRFCVQVERQQGNLVTLRPMQLAVELSDSSFAEGQRSTDEAMAASDGGMVTLNLSDASAEVLSKGLEQWQEWRSSTADRDETLDRMAQDGPVNGEISIIDGSIRLGSPTKTVASEQAATQQAAAQAALSFATKRGAATSRKSESAKPFVFRNKTGVSIAFVHKGARDVPPSKRRSWAPIGEYSGLMDHDKNVLTIVADQDEARFDLDIVPISTIARGGTERDRTDLSKHFASGKVRSYDGHFPSLTVAIQALPGIQMSPIQNLKVHKVGNFMKYLHVTKAMPQLSQAETPGAPTAFDIPLVWSVEIEDNRRVLTLSSAVRVSSSCLDTSIAVGVVEVESSEEGMVGAGTIMATVDEDDTTSIRQIGVASFDKPYFLPLWLTLKFQPIRVFARPVGGKQYAWGEHHILDFKLDRDVESSHHPKALVWRWGRSFSGRKFMRCNSEGNLDRKAAWLSCCGASLSKVQSLAHQSKERRRAQLKSIPLNGGYDMLAVDIDAGLTVRNMLPAEITFQVKAIKSSRSSLTCLPSTPSQSKRSLPIKVSQGDQELGETRLQSGHYSNVFECNCEEDLIIARFKSASSKRWTEWAPIALEVDARKHKKRHSNSSPSASMPLAQREAYTSLLDIQIPDTAFGPQTIGLKMTPKMMSFPGKHEDSSLNSFYGIEVNVYAAFWIRNLTKLPLDFGCPVHQMIGQSNEIEAYMRNTDQSVARFTAESALMELSSVLEFGDRGIGLGGKDSKNKADTGDIRSLPNQVGETFVEEIFEYAEVEDSMTKRKWWASEDFRSARHDATEVEDHIHWEWSEDKWTIDCAGNASPSTSGWESCRGLLAGFGTFHPDRNFDPSHSFRRRRWYRSKIAKSQAHSNLLQGLQVFHHPSNYHAMIQQQEQHQKNPFAISAKNHKSKKESKGKHSFGFKMSAKVGDGKWCAPVVIPVSGTCHGVLRVFKTRWSALTSKFGERPMAFPPTPEESKAKLNHGADFGCAPLDPTMCELCYTVSDAEGEWGDFSRLMKVSPRFIVRNDSKRYFIEVKQTGAPDSSLLLLQPGEAEAFYWADYRLPGLVSLRPAVTNSQAVVYQWSGGFDICNLGMAPIRTRPAPSNDLEDPTSPKLNRSFRALVEIRPGTGGFGINFSFREEDAFGNGALFRIENSCPFPIWIAQDGVLANPTSDLMDLRSSPFAPSSPSRSKTANGDCVEAGQSVAYALDIPYRQGKYVHRKAATMAELLRLRVALAPLATRLGIESVKVIGLTDVGQTVRLNPSKLAHLVPEKIRERLASIRILGLIVNDGPTRALKFCMIKNNKLEKVFENPFVDVAYNIERKNSLAMKSGTLEQHAMEMAKASSRAVEIIDRRYIPTEEEARQRCESPNAESDYDALRSSGSLTTDIKLDTVYSLRAAFDGFVISLIDSAPSEICVIVAKDVNVLGTWNSNRTSDASGLLSIGWLQIDNHVPNAAFPVALKPDVQAGRFDDEDDSDDLDDVDDEYDDDSDRNSSGDESIQRGIYQGRLGDHATASNIQPESDPFLLVGLSVAPKHKSGITCLHSVTIAPSHLIIAVDLAFLVRLQHFLASFAGHFDTKTAQASELNSQKDQTFSQRTLKGSITPPTLMSVDELTSKAASVGVKNIKFYFKDFTVIPFTLRLSVAPARALTSAQSNLEGPDAAAIHQAVRKGDVLLGNTKAVLGVKIGRKNTTAMAVVRGVFKSIVVDALLRLDGASLNFAGISLRNHISTTPQLSTYLLTHYMASLRQNVPALLGSLAAFGNPLGLIRGVGEGMADFVSEPVKGLQKSVQELDPGYLFDGVARGTGSLARHTVGGFADSASLLTETFSKNMAVLTLDRRYAQKRDRGISLKEDMREVTFAVGVESGFYKLVQGFQDGVTGVVKAPMRGAERRGIEGFAKGVGKGLLGLLVKPMIGISDAATDVMIGVKSTVDHPSVSDTAGLGPESQFRPRRPMYGRDKILRSYSAEDAAAATLMLRTRLAGENYLSHLEMASRVALFSIRGMLMLGPQGQELLAVKFKHVADIEIRSIQQEDGSPGWGMIILLNTPRRNGSDVEVLCCPTRTEALELISHLRRGVDLVINDMS